MPNPINIKTDSISIWLKCGFVLQCTQLSQQLNSTNSGLNDLQRQLGRIYNVYSYVICETLQITCYNKDFKKCTIISILWTKVTSIFSWTTRKNRTQKKWRKNLPPSSLKGECRYCKHSLNVNHRLE